jgi:glucose-6-phosphate 1-dehydrogenase
MAQEADGYRRTIIEKPFGTDRSSAAALNAAVHDVFDERQVYRIDLRSGKALAEKVSEIVIQFRAPPHVMFPLPAGARLQSNYLAICVQPDEGMHLRLEAKVPDTIAELRAVDMEFHYDEGFDGLAIPDAYERLLLDALQGDPSLFARSDGIELSWKAIDPIIEGWRGPDAPRLETYAPGSWGPGGADALLRRDGRSWRRGCGQHGTHGTR